MDGPPLPPLSAPSTAPKLAEQPATSSSSYPVEFVGDAAPSGGGGHHHEHRQSLDTAFDSTVLLDAHLRDFWAKQIKSAEEETPDFKHPALPLARIKKVMKSDPDVKMIGSDGPILFAKACEIFIAEVTSRAWLVASAHKRRTLSRADIAKAIAKSDQFDFLIDIVPREMANEKGRSGGRVKDTAEQDGGEDEQDLEGDHDHDIDDGGEDDDGGVGAAPGRAGSEDIDHD